MDQTDLPYPGLQLVVSPRGGWHVKDISDAITAGTAQFPQGYQAGGGRIADSEGALCFWGDAVAFYAESGASTSWMYNAMKTYAIKRGLLMTALTIWGGDGSRARFKIGSQLAANADYILSKLGIPAAR